MKIQHLQGAMNAYNNKGKVSPKQEVKSKSGEQDAMNVSQEAKTFSAVLQAVKKSPDIREEKVSALKEAIANNTYKVDDEKLVDKLIERMERKF